jgi:hypothetical protein
MRFRRYFVATIGALLVASLAMADAPQTGVVTGVVKGPDDSAMPGATVQLMSDRDTRTSTSGQDGGFRFVFLAPGSYIARADLSGFQHAEGEIVVSAGGRAFVELRLGEFAADEIVVTGESPLVSRYDVSASSSIESEVAEQLVFAERTYRSTILMAPGVVPYDRADRGPMVMGNSPNEMASFIDGVDVSVTKSGGLTRLFLPTTSLAEVRVDGSAYGSEYGRVIGGFNSAVTKSGTNDFHGSFQYIAQNQAWAAQSKHIPLEREDDIQGKFEVGLGGPIYRDKAWFFVAASESTTNELTHLAGGDIINYSVETESRLLKLDFAPSASHRLAVTALRAPLVWPIVAENLFYDRFTVVHLNQGNELVTANWSWSISEDLFFELRGARQSGDEVNTTIATPEVDPSASPDDPAGNQNLYVALSPFAFHHGPGSNLGRAEFPRDQANAILTWFGGRHELKFGIDYQNPVMDTGYVRGPRYYGRGYNETLPGGFAVPSFKRVYHPVVGGSLRTETDVLNGFVQDRFDVADRWTFMVGLRYEQQDHMNDLGETVLSSSDLSPRLAAIYDVGGDGELLVKATVGRYSSVIPQVTINDYLSSSSSGTNSWDDYLWNRATGLYNRPWRSVLPEDRAANAVEPFYKDEITLGFEWQFNPLWVFKTRAVYWEVKDQWAAQEQFDENGEVIRQVWNPPGGGREYKGIQFELNRRFRSNWVLRANYTLSQLEGNMVSWNESFMEGYAVVDPETGVPITAINRWGPPNRDVNNIVNVAGSKTFRIGSHSLQLGGYVRYYTGRAWNLQEAVTLTHPESGEEIISTRFLEPSGAHRLSDNHYINLNGTWRFPISGPVNGSLRVEVANIDDPQEQIGINENTGEPAQNRRSWQKPREFRLVVGVSF